MENERVPSNEQLGEPQVVEGLIGSATDRFEERLPKGITPEMVHLFLGNDNKWHWHLRPEHIRDSKAREEYIHEVEEWPLD